MRCWIAARVLANAASTIHDGASPRWPKGRRDSQHRVRHLHVGPDPLRASRIPHDMQRTAVRNLVRAGGATDSSPQPVSRTFARPIGWGTRRDIRTLPANAPALDVHP